jgi:RNA polymerase sigma-70 factor (ECF subfamily)
MAETPRARFERICRDYGPQLSRAVQSYARPGADADDLAQEVMLALWRALPGFRGECPERAFVLRVAHNRGLNFLFRRKPTDPDVPDVPDPRPSAEAQLDRSQQVERMYAAIRALPLAQRQVLTLALEELPHAEIAEVLGTRVENVAVRLTRARAALRAQLAPAEPERSVS